MTLLEKYLADHKGEDLSEVLINGLDCPGDYGISKFSQWKNCPTDDEDCGCVDCWKQEYREEEPHPIPYEKRKEIYLRAISHYGNKQINKAIEELSELTQALCKYSIGEPDFDNISEEIADVTIMCEQLRLLFSCNERVNAIMDKKIARLVERMEALE